MLPAPHTGFVPSSYSGRVGEDGCLAPGDLSHFLPSLKEGSVAPQLSHGHDPEAQPSPGQGPYAAGGLWALQPLGCRRGYIPSATSRTVGQRGGPQMHLPRLGTRLGFLGRTRSCRAALSLLEEDVGCTLQGWLWGGPWPQHIPISGLEPSV